MGAILHILLLGLYTWSIKVLNEEQIPRNSVTEMQTKYSEKNDLLIGVCMTNRISNIDSNTFTRNASYFDYFSKNILCRDFASFVGYSHFVERREFDTSIFFSNSHLYILILSIYI
jgi:hypothetical protein